MIDPKSTEDKQHILIKDVSFGIQAQICLEPLHPKFPTFNFSAGFF